jgi:hypothetical protein
MSRKTAGLAADVVRALEDAIEALRSPDLEPFDQAILGEEDRPGHPAILRALGAEDAATGERLPVRVEDYLTPAQARQMRSQPDLIGAFARLVRLRFRGEGREVRVRGEVWASLNGRPACPLVDPGADLARGGPADWVRPLPDGT